MHRSQRVRLGSSQLDGGAGDEVKIKKPNITNISRGMIFWSELN